MSQKPHRFLPRIAFLLILLLILFGESAAKGTAEGVDLCVRCIIPALFPFFVLTNWATPYLSEIKIPGFTALARYLHIPQGAEMIFIIGLLGGYPVGAQTISLQWKNQSFTRSQAHHLLGFCSNAGPGFIFGIARIIFQNPIIPWCIWSIQIFSAYITGLILPYPAADAVRMTKHPAVSITTAMRQSVLITGSVCGWIIFTKAILGIVTSAMVFSAFQTYLTGFIELSAGCFALMYVPSDALKFILMNVFLSFGGICVWMQTCSVTEGLGTGLYLPGKVIQMFISLQLSILLSLFLFPEFTFMPVNIIILLFFSWVIISLTGKISRKKMWKLS